MELTREELSRIILEEIHNVKLESAIKEITRRKFCQMMAATGGALATGCGSDYNLLHSLGQNEEGMPAPECIQNPQFIPSLDDPDAWTEEPVKLYEFMSQPVFGSDSIFVEDDSEILKIIIMNVPITADIWNIRHTLGSKNKVFSDEQLLGLYTEGAQVPEQEWVEGEMFGLLTVTIQFRIYTNEDGEEFIAGYSDGGGLSTIPQRRGNCLEEYEEWLGPRNQQAAMVDEIVKEELEVVLQERCQKGYKTHKKRKTKKMFGRTYRNCVKAEEGLETQQKKVVEGDPKKGTGKKPKGSGRRLYTDEDPTDTVSVKFSSVQDVKDTLSKASFKSKSHKRQSQIINLIHQRSRAAYKNAKDPKAKARLKKAYEYAEKRKEASKRKTAAMNKKKK